MVRTSNPRVTEHSKIESACTCKLLQAENCLIQIGGSCFYSLVSSGAQADKQHSTTPRPDGFCVKRNHFPLKKNGTYVLNMR